ncbi:hypothetical protein GQ464_015100 [Rhodocaloribacter litoris]|uniref:hypothetical protein n=1 Tax=Rhodocaloribacter litoris TaxID=2558931 RepID=UPI0014201E17|nr:hypothetical protein [Rhodocaloribacter litoris]QXD14735.1 hypothetical protein GQ464_015100 [Rhodocaloribacter litoris]
MRRTYPRLLMMIGLVAFTAHEPVFAQPALDPPAATADLDLTAVRVRHLTDLGVLVFEQEVAGTAGATVPEAAGRLDGAPVLGYVFPTTLAPEDVGFAPGEGVVALAATSHPDFDDTPLWDENGDRIYDNDGRIYHTHWVVLIPDERVPGGLAVKETKRVQEDLPPTAPGMPMYLDSPGFAVLLRGKVLRIPVPVDRVGGRTDFRFDGVTAYMQVNQSDPNRPLLGVYRVYEVLSGDLSLPYAITQE